MEKEDQSLVPEGEGLLSGGPVLMIVFSFGTDSKFAWVAPRSRCCWQRAPRSLGGLLRLKVDCHEGRKVPCRCLNT